MSGKVDAGKPKKLGRGLSSLMQIEVPVEVTPRHEQNTNTTLVTAPAAAAAAPTPASVAPPVPERGLRYIPVASIDPNRYQPRRVFDADQLKSLSESIRRSGLMQPVVVRPAHGDPGRFELVAGERRWRAAALAELASIPAIVRDLSDQEAAEWAVVENVQRADLNPMERADAFRALVESFGLTHSQIGERVGLDRSSVANFIRLTELEPEVRELLGNGQLSFGHGKALLSAPAGQARVTLAAKAAEQGWSVRQLEANATGTPALVGKAGQSPDQTGDVGVKDLERRLGEYLGTKINLKTNAKGSKGRIVIEFYGLDHFDGLMSRIGFRGV